jgi:parallel beta-helix repeat protein
MKKASIKRHMNFSEMRKRVAGVLLLSLLMVDIVILAFCIRPAFAERLIYVRADGSVDPPTAPISTTDNITYTFTENIGDQIVVQRSDIMIDGNGYSHESQGESGICGFNLTSINNVTIRNVEIKNFAFGIYLHSSSYDVVTGSNISDCDYGVRLYESSSNTILDSKITNNTASGIAIQDSSNNTLFEVSLESNDFGIGLDSSSNNTVYNTSITTSRFVGIWLDASANNTFYHNNFMDNPVQVNIETPGYANFWDDGYPSGGNYWSDHAGADYYSGPVQDQPGSDGIGDTPHILDENNADRYPIMNREKYDWPMLGRDPAMTGHSLSTAPDTNEIAWTSNLPGGTVWANPVVQKGKVFIGAGGYLNAFDDNTGGYVWGYQAPSQPGYPCCTAAGGGRVFYGTGEPGPAGCMYALDQSTGEQLWSFNCENYVRDPVIVGDRLFFGCDTNDPNQGKIYCLNATTGSPIWNYVTQDKGVNVAVAYGRVYVACGLWTTSATGCIYCFSAADGALVWSYQTSRDLTGKVAVADGKVFFSASREGADCVVYALDAANGNEVWKVNSYSSGEAAGTAVADGKLFVTFGYGAMGVYALNETNGAQIWAFPTEWNPTGVAVADGKVFFGVGLGGHMVYALNETTGSVVWSYTLSGYVHSRNNAVADGRLFVADNAYGKLYAFGPPYQGAVCNLDITTTAGGTTMPPSANYTYTHGTVVGVRAIPQSGYGFDHWELDSSWDYSNPISITMNSNHTLRAIFNYTAVINAHCYTENADVSISIAMDGSSTGYTTPCSFNLTEAHNFTVPDTDTNGHLFTQWNTGETSTTITVASSGTYIAYYQARYNLTITTTEGGTTDPPPGNYSYWDGTTASVTPTPTLGYLLDHWELDSADAGTSNPISIIMNMSHTLNPVFSWVGICNLTITTTTGGTTNPTSGVYSYTNGTSTEITAIPDAGYGLDHWELDGFSIGSQNPTTVMMDSNHTLNAVFKLTYELTITTTAGGTTDPSLGTHTYIEGTTVTATATAYSDNAFDHWELDGSWNYSNPINVTMDANHTLHAVFTYSVTIVAHCDTEAVDVSVSISIDGSPTGYTTPHTFTNLTGTHTFTVTDSDPSGHPFFGWSTGNTSTTISVSSAGTYTAHYYYVFAQPLWHYFSEGSANGMAGPKYCMLC